MSHFRCPEIIGVQGALAGKPHHNCSAVSRGSEDLLGNPSLSSARPARVGAPRPPPFGPSLLGDRKSTQTFSVHASEHISDSAVCYAGSGLPQGPFLGNNLFPLKVSLRWVFVNGLKWVQKWVKSGVFGCKSGSKFVKTHFCTHFKPISAYSRKPTFYPV